VDVGPMRLDRSPLYRPPMDQATPPLAQRVIDSMTGWKPATWWRVFAFVAVALLFVLALPLLLGHPSYDDHPVAILGFGAGASLPLVFQRRWPRAALAVITASAVGAALFDVRFSVLESNATPAVAISMAVVAAQLDRRRSVVALVVVVAATFAAGWVATDVHSGEVNAVHSIAAVVGWFVGDTVRARRAYRAELAAQRRWQIEERTRRAIVEERLQISRELHDVISHNMTVIAVRSGIGRMLFDAEPAEARAALAEAESMSRSALTELRRLLSALRDRDSLDPAPKIADIELLVERVRASGLDVRYHVVGVGAPLPPTLELSAYRIVQEALTNVVKHAGDVRSTVTVQLDADALRIEVGNDGGAAPASPSEGDTGWGLTGMRERAAVFDGTVDAGPRPEGGFRVVVRLPVKLEVPAA